MNAPKWSVCSHQLDASGDLSTAVHRVPAVYAFANITTDSPFRGRRSSGKHSGIAEKPDTGKEAAHHSDHTLQHAMPRQKRQAQQLLVPCMANRLMQFNIMRSTEQLPRQTHLLLPWCMLIVRTKIYPSHTLVWVCCSGASPFNNTQCGQAPLMHNAAAALQHPLRRILPTSARFLGLCTATAAKSLGDALPRQPTGLRLILLAT